MKIYTRTGDRGETGLFGGARVPKGHPRVTAYGHVDELNSLLGVALAHLGDPEGCLAGDLRGLQADLFVLGADLATPPDTEARTERIREADVTRLEGWIDRRQEGLPELRSFVLPGGTRAASFLHLARAVCRRAERAVLEVPERESVEVCAVYLNRLSDLLFVMARAANHQAPDGPEEIPWKGSR